MLFLRSVFPPTRRGIIVVKPWKLAYARVPKAANTAIKVAMAEALGLKEKSAGRISRDAFWRTVDPMTVAVVSPSEFATDRYRDYFCFSVVRHPFSRIVSCYKNKILRNTAMRKGFRRDGFSPGMTLDDFIGVVVRTQDRSCNVHVQSQAAMLTYKGRVLPQMAVKHEALGIGWPKIAQRVAEHCGATLPSLVTTNSTASVDQDVHLTDAHQALLRIRYAGDFENFYRGEHVP